jgi:hypothetical protein
LIAIVEITSNAYSVFNKKAITPRKPEPRTKAHYCNIRSLVQNKRHPMKKEATSKHKGLKTKDI